MVERFRKSKIRGIFQRNPEYRVDPNDEATFVTAAAALPDEAFIELKFIDDQVGKAGVPPGTAYRQDIRLDWSCNQNVVLDDASTIAEQPVIGCYGTYCYHSKGNLHLIGNRATSATSPQSAPPHSFVRTISTEGISYLPSAVEFMVAHELARALGLWGSGWYISGTRDPMQGWPPEGLGPNHHFFKGSERFRSPQTLPP